MKFIFLVLLINVALAAETPPGEPPYRHSSKEKHDMRIINSGAASLYARVDMIRRAQKSIDLESYIFNTDTAGKVILHELKEAAKRGVRVRILVDKFIGVHKLDEHIAQELKKTGVDVRYYNPAPIINLASVQFRNHRKLMVRDGEEAITGGRNISNEYFDLSKDFNFLDRDITVEGEVVKSMGQTFENYWNSRLTEVPRKPERPDEYAEGNGWHEAREFDRKKEFAQKLLEEDPEVKRILALLDTHGKESFQQHQKHHCPEVTFASDREGASFRKTFDREKYIAEYRLLRQEIDRWLNDKVKEEVIIDTPYFLHSPLTERFVKFLNEKKIRIKVFTNSLASTDAVHVSTVFNNSVTDFTPHEGFRAYVYKGKYSGEGKIHEEKVKKSTWGTHSKSMVFSDDAFMIGSYNVDNRSSYFNTELAIFCSGSPELTRDVKENIQVRMDNSFRLNANGYSDDCDDIHGDAGPLKRLMYWLLKIPSHLLQDLL